MTPSSPVTLRALAAAAGVSVGTVSRALKNQPGLSEPVRQAILRKAEEMGYDLLRLRSAKPRRLLFMLNRELASLRDNPFYSVVLQGVESACRDENIPLGLLAVGRGDPVAGWVRRQAAEGLIAAGFFEPGTLDALRATDLPLVLVDHAAPDLFAINDDNARGAWLATRHLLGQGRRRIALISGPEAHHSIRLRVQGYRQALADAGRTPDPALEVTLDPALDYAAAGADAMRRLLDGPAPPDAVFAYNDETALYAMGHCLSRGCTVPGHIAFVGYDDIAAAARARPSLSTVRVDKEALGRAAVQQLVSGAPGPGELLLPVELVQRESSRPAT